MGVKKLFLVDDDEIFGKVAKVLIESKGIAENVIHLENGLKAYDLLILLSESPMDLPEIMLLDINMPVMNGWELLEELKSAPSIIKTKVQIHILTSSIDPKDLNLSKTYDFIDGYITKPLTETDLDELLKRS